MEERNQPDLIDRAIELAVRAHGEQRRKGTDTAYITHPFSVAVMLAKAGCPDETIAAGILHDATEDTPLKLEEIRKEFGDSVASIVETCSEPDKALPWEERKEHTLRSLGHASLHVRLVACADKLHNIRTIGREMQRVGEDVWLRFSRGKEQQRWYYTSLVSVLCNRKDTGGYPSLFEDFRKEVEKVFGKEEQE